MNSRKIDDPFTKEAIKGVTHSEFLERKSNLLEQLVNITQCVKDLDFHNPFDRNLLYMLQEDLYYFDLDVYK